MSNEPVLIAYAVKDRPAGKKAIWTRIGAAWPHDKGAGLTVILDFLPVDRASCWSSRGSIRRRIARSITQPS